MVKQNSLVCPECGERFVPKHHRAQFCSREHQSAYNSRRKAQGFRIVSLALAHRLGRNTKDPDAKAAASVAWTEMCRLLDEITAEDLAAGRPNALAVYRRRMAAGLLD